MRSRWEFRWRPVVLLVAVGTGLVFLSARMSAGLIAQLSLWSGIVGLGAIPVNYLRATWNRGRVPSTPDQVSCAREALAGLVEVQWRREAVVRRLHEPDPMTVRWRVSRRGVIPVQPRRIIGRNGRGFLADTSDVPRLARWFRELRRSRLVILGGPGAGKTTLAVLLLLELLAQRTTGDPVPVLFTLTGWDPDAWDFPSWLARRLTEDYPALLAADVYGPTAARDLIDGRHILPFIDGLDEIPPLLRTKVIGALNRAMSQDHQLILTARTEEYAASTNAVHGAAVVEPDPMSPDAIADYLGACLAAGADASWDAVLRTIRRGSGSPLSQALAIPLVLWLFREVQVATGADASPLTDLARFPTAEAITGHLIDQLVSALIDANRPARPGRPENRPFQPRRRWDPDDARRWLSQLASQAHSLNTRDLAWWQLPRAIPRWQIKLSCAVITGLLLAPVLGPALSFIGRFFGPGVAPAPADGALAQLLVGLAAGIPFGFLVSSGPATTAASATRRRQAVSRVLARRSARGIFTGVSIATVAGIATGIGDHATGAGIGGGAIAGIGAGVGAMCRPSPGLMPSYANFSRDQTRILRREILRGLARGGLAALAFGLIVGLIEERTLGLGLQLLRVVIVVTRAIGLPIGFAFGLASGLIRGATSPSGSARPGTPVSSLRDGRRIFIFHGLTFALATSLGPGLIMASRIAGFSLQTRLEVGLTIGLVAGLSAGLAVGLGDSWPSYTVTRLLLAARQQLPIRLTGFLDDAYRLGILRQVGAAYQFRHATLQDHLAAPRQPNSPAGR